MALEIKNTNGEICITGNASEMQLTQVKNYLTALMTIKNEVLINITNLKTGKESCIKMIEDFKTQIEAYQSIYYYGAATVKQLHPTHTLPVSIYLAA